MPLCANCKGESASASASESERRRKRLTQNTTTSHSLWMDRCLLRMKKRVLSGQGFFVILVLAWHDILRRLIDRFCLSHALASKKRATLGKATIHLNAIEQEEQ